MYGVIGLVAVIAVIFIFRTVSSPITSAERAVEALAGRVNDLVTSQIKTLDSLAQQAGKTALVAAESVKATTEQQLRIAGQMAQQHLIVSEQTLKIFDEQTLAMQRQYNAGMQANGQAVQIVSQAAITAITAATGQIAGNIEKGAANIFKDLSNYGSIIDKGVNSINNSTNRVLDVVKEVPEEVKEAVSEGISSGVNKLDDTVYKGVQRIDNEGWTVISRIDNEVGNGLQQIDVATGNGVNQVNAAAGNGVGSINAALSRFPGGGGGGGGGISIPGFGGGGGGFSL